MSVIVKALLKSLIEKKARTFLVIFSIAVSAALIFANESFARTVTQRFYEADVRWSGISDFYIGTRNAVGAKEWIDPQKLSAYRDSFEYTYPFIKEKGITILMVTHSEESTQYGNRIIRLKDGEIVA